MDLWLFHFIFASLMSSQTPPNLETQIRDLTERGPRVTGSVEGGRRSYLTRWDPAHLQDTGTAKAACWASQALPVAAFIREYLSQAR